MGRIRTIKPEFWKHEDLSALPEATHMLAAALLNYADDEGYFNANPLLIKAEIFPLREPSTSVPRSLQLLSRAGYLRLGKGEDGRAYGHILKFLSHQRVDKPTKSKIKELSITWEEESALQEASGNTPGGLQEDSQPEQGTGNREREGKGKEEAAAAARAREPLGGSSEHDPGSWTDDQLREEVMAAVGLQGTPIPTHWMPPMATMHVGRWRTDLGLDGRRIVDAARLNRQRHIDPPQGPKALDAVMRRLAGELHAAPMRPEAQASPPGRGSPPAHKPLTLADLRAMVVPTTERPQ